MAADSAFQKKLKPEDQRLSQVFEMNNQKFVRTLKYNTTTQRTEVFFENVADRNNYSKV